MIPQLSAGCTVVNQNQWTAFKSSTDHQETTHTFYMMNISDIPVGLRSATTTPPETREAADVPQLQHTVKSSEIKRTLLVRLK